MDDLISRSAVMTMLTDIELNNGTLTEAKSKLRDIPTAYNVDKVVEEIKDMSFRQFGEISEESVLKIIKAGGVNG